MAMAMRLMLKRIRTVFPSVHQMSTPQLYDIINTPNDAQPQKLVLLDVRPEEEYLISHLDGAIRVDPEEMGTTVLEKVKGAIDQNGHSHASRDATSNIVCYCSTGYRSSSMAQKLSEALETQKGSNQAQFANYNVYNLEGSLFKWANEEKPMVDQNNKPTKVAHPFNKLFGLLLHRDFRH